MDASGPQVAGQQFASSAAHGRRLEAQPAGDAGIAAASVAQRFQAGEEAAQALLEQAEEEGKGLRDRIRVGWSKEEVPPSPSLSTVAILIVH